MAARDGSSRRLLVRADAAQRVAATADWIAAAGRADELLVLGAAWGAADELVRTVVRRDGARFGIARLTLDRLAGRLAERRLAARGLAPIAGLSYLAVVARAVHLEAAEERLAYHAPVATTPGFAVAVGRTIEEMRMNDVGAAAVAALGRGGPDLATLMARVEHELADDRLADRADVYAEAARAMEEDEPWPAGLPLVLLDVEVRHAREEALLRAVVARAPRLIATAPAGDGRTVASLERVLDARAEATTSSAATSLGRLQQHLFTSGPSDEQPLDGTVAFTAWPDEARECIEIARTIQSAAARGTPFDEVAVVLHAPRQYASHLEEAFARAEIPVFGAAGTQRPLPAGRALLALLGCASEGLSARRFAEYLSLGQVPVLTADADEPSFAPPVSDLLPTAEPWPAPARPIPPVLVDDPGAAAVIEGTLQAPWRWEQLLVDAAVIGSRERWARRLAGLRHEIERRHAELDDDAGQERLVRTRRDLEHLEAFALPVIARLADLPDRAPWGEWLRHLTALVTVAIRDGDAVVETLAELGPMGPIGPVDVDEVLLVLTPRLRDLTVAPPRRRYGAVFVAPPAGMRGLAFDLVFVPGLAENLVPGRVMEDPILLDHERVALGAGLALEADRIAEQRLALRVAVGAARRRVVLSYPRVDVERARPRVPSVYALDVLGAAEGRLPGLGELTRRARAAGGARLGWPAPDDAAQAIDESEYDLALLAPLIDADPETTIGTATYLLGANAHLARALRTRARRWLTRWTPADGLVDPSPEARHALARHQMGARSYSPTALQHYAACPYRFFLQAIHRLQPREEPVAIDTMDPLTRGSIFHDVQFGVLSRLREADLLPLDAARVDAAMTTLDQVLATEEARVRDDLFPAIPRVWDDAIAGIRADLREWLARMATSPGGWVPHRFELAFGLGGRDRPHVDPASVDAPVRVLDGMLVRGSIDLVERRADGAVRVTDHKTGRVAAAADVIVGGGTVLQPVLYALAYEAMTGERVEAGRLHYCTAAGEFTERTVPLDGRSRDAAERVMRTIDAALADGFLPAAPAPRACTWCDYRLVCGPWEETRVARKPAGRLEALARLRGLA